MHDLDSSRIDHRGAPEPELRARGSQPAKSEVAARAAGRTVVAFHASRDDEIETAFARIIQMRPGALLVGSDPFFNSRREQIVALAARHAIPAIYEWREFAQAGGLMSYGTSLIEAYRQAGSLRRSYPQGRKARRPAGRAATKFELVINLITAKALGLTFPPGLLAIADEVIEWDGGSSSRCRRRGGGVAGRGTRAAARRCR